MKRMMILVALLLVVPGVMASHDNSVCELTSVKQSNVNFVWGTIPSEISEGDNLDVDIIVSILGGSEGLPDEELTMEVGMYPVDSPQALAVISSATNLAVNPNRNCVEDEEFVDTVHIQTVNPQGGDSLITFEIQAPVDGSLNDGGEREYIIQAVVFKNCYKQCADTTGSQPIRWESQPITLLDNPEKTADTSTDGVQNDDETDIDCGGSTGNECPLGYACEVSGDCKGDNVCSNSICQPETSDNPVGAGAGPLLLVVMGVLIVGGAVWFLRR